jgi:hypothetical protein
MKQKPFVFNHKRARKATIRGLLKYGIEIAKIRKKNSVEIDELFKEIDRYYMENRIAETKKVMNGSRTWYGVKHERFTTTIRHKIEYPPYMKEKLARFTWLCDQNNALSRWLVGDDEIKGKVCIDSLLLEKGIDACNGKAGFCEEMICDLRAETEKNEPFYNETYHVYKSFPDGKTWKSYKKSKD